MQYNIVLVGTKSLKSPIDFLGLFWNENKQNGNDQNCWNMKQEKKVCSKNELKSDRWFSSSGSMGELKFAGDAQLFCSAILLLPSD